MKPYLDYEVKLTPSGRWRVWLGDAGDGVIAGSGYARTQALKDAILNLEGTLELLREEFRKATT